MVKTVKRSYDASGRRARAAESRERILASALELFVEQGYGQTSLKQVAESAHVSVETVYSAFGSKAELLRRAWYFASRGDADDVTLYDRPEMQQILSEPDLARRLRRYAAFVAALNRRMSPLLLMLQGAAANEPGAAAMLTEWAGRRIDVATRFAIAAAETGQLSVSTAACRDILFATMHGDLWRQLVGERRWSEKRFATWLADLWISQLVT